MRSFAFAAVGLGFVLMGAGLFALTLRKPKDKPAVPTKAQQREQAVLDEEKKKMHIAAGVSVAVGLALIVLMLF